MSILQKEIRGLPRAVAISTLAGIVVGALCGVGYGYFMESHALRQEWKDVRAGNVNYRLEDGKLPTKQTNHIRAESRANGLSFGTVVGAAIGFALAMRGTEHRPEVIELDGGGASGKSHT